MKDTYSISIEISNTESISLMQLGLLCSFSTLQLNAFARLCQTDQEGFAGDLFRVDGKNIAAVVYQIENYCAEQPTGDLLNIGGHECKL